MAIHFNKTKIIATVGPASNTPERLRALIQEGVDVFRLNFSHGTHPEHLKVIEHVRAINAEEGFNICLVQDLQGPKIRLNDIENGAVEIVAGQQVTIVCDKSVGTSTRLSTSYLRLAHDVRPGDAILIDDGKLELTVISTDGDKEVLTEVVYGGVVKPRKGINLPDTVVTAPSLTEKDIQDLHFGLDNDVEWVALSFVRKVEDIHEIKRIIAERGKDTRVIAKVEKPEAIRNIDSIIEATDAVMVARGDLGVEIGMEEVPMLQKMIVEKCQAVGKPVIIATQMMESMITNPRPTRAETNDIANAVMDGADTLMLSAETAAGAYPIETIRSMNRTIQSVESQAEVFHRNFVYNPEGDTFMNDTVVASAVGLARDTDARALIGLTKSGYTAFQLAKHRPKSHIFIFTDNRALLTTLNLVWGIRGFYYDRFVSTDDTISDLKEILLREGHLEKGDVFINIGSMPVMEKKRANMIKLSIVH
ncbi:pyruvate kinase [Rufibacter radiotolerans]|uniref:Pyruvate kinase n=1 Tax=Rufibacter radiotolerans TaxID=1379910 RepID=A0A0H4VLG7_9BACT|nr:pyruvate kinase [Rufibacter radiotolerans]AKQ44752.1 pyruvate kinase [Rufibacter radiotolerans]